MKVFEVNSEELRREFINFPKKLYRKDPVWVCPLDKSVESVFNPKTNTAFRHGAATRWILMDDSGSVIGRVGAFIDEVRSAANRQPTGGMGFFEVIESREAAFMLFDTAREWLASKGMKAMDGPIKFGENDYFWGLLVDGFTTPASGCHIT